MTARITPGIRLKRSLDAMLDADDEWDEREQVMVDKAVSSEDRAAALQRLLDAELAKPLPSSRKVTELAGEIRQLDGVVVKIVCSLKPEGTPAAQGASTAPPAQGAPLAQVMVMQRDRRSHRGKPVATTRVLP